MKKSRIFLSLLMASFLFSLFNTIALAGVSNDQVLSQHIKEADGTSGQNTNSGSGIKTGHIQDGAITTPKIVDGAVTDAKITGPISASKISSTGLNADTVDGKHASDLASAVHTHNQSEVNGLTNALAGKAEANHHHDSVYQKKYGKIAVVAKSGGEYSDPIAAMNDLATWCGTPSATNPCLLKIMPGVYNIGSNSLQMRQYVDTEGSGESTTRIIGNVDGYGVIIGASNAELRFLTIEGKQTGGYFGLAVNNTAASPKITNVTAIASGGSYTNYGFVNDSDSAPILTNVTVIVQGAKYHGYGILNSSNPNADYTILENVTVTVTGGWSDGLVYGVYNTQNSKTVMRNAKVTVTDPNGGYGVYNNDSIIKIDNSVINGPSFSVYSPGGTAYIGYTKLENSLGGTLKCIGVYDGDYNPIICP